MAKFHEITGYFAGDNKTPYPLTINIDHILWIIGDKDNPNITYLKLGEHLTFVVGHNIKNVLEAFSK